MPLRFTTVKAGTLVEFDGLGIQVSADFNDPEFDSQPFVTINTEELPERFCYAEHGDRRPGVPIIAVHLNDATIYDDEGAGPVHRSDTPKTDRLKRAEALLTEAHKRIGSDALADEIQTFLEER